MEVVRINEVPLKATPRGIKGRHLVDLPAASIMNLVLEPGEKVPLHKTPVDVLFHVIAGEGSVTIGEETAAVAAGEIIISPKKIPHALEADVGKTFSVLVIKTPNPAKRA